MAIVTRLVQGKKDPTRVNVFLDHKFALSLSAEEVIKQSLAIGKNLSDDIVVSLKKTSQEEKIFSKLINFLSYRPRSEKEVKDRLRKYLPDAPHDYILGMCDKLKSLGYLNDLEFARWFAHSRVKSRPRSTRHLAQELYQKGLSKEVIANVLSEFSDDRAALRALLTKKSTLPKDKLISYLARRGFSWELIKEEVDKDGVDG